MADVYPVAGCKIYIGAAKASQAADFTSSDFTSQSWLEIDGFETMGAFGDNAALITTPLINRGRDVKQKGTANAGQMQCNFASLATDPGQIALIAASSPSVKDNYAFKLELNDAPDSGTPSIRYFVALVMGAVEQGGGANTARLLQSTLEINSNIVKVSASA